MPKLSASLSFLFTELPLADRFAAAAKAGFKGVECIDPYSLPPGEIGMVLQQWDLEFVLFNLPAGDWAAGDRGLAADPARRVEFRESLDLGLRYAKALACPRVHVMAGTAPRSVHRHLWRDTLIENLGLAGRRAAEEGVEILLEPLNSRVDVPEYFYDSTDTVCEIIDALALPNVKLLYDVYHRQIMQGDIARGLEALLPRIGHIQIADNPGRGEPGTGEVNFPYLLGRLDALGYDGWVGCEYQPTTTTHASLHWAKPYLRPGALTKGAV